MDQIFSLPIFPPGTLAGTVTTTVWVGVLVSCFFNLRYGWVLSGLVVPGYMVPLLLLKPWAAAVVVAEAIISYLAVWTYSEWLPRLGLGNGLFGRDRFFALFLASVIVRVILETFVLPQLGESLNAAYQLDFDYRNNLHSFGLIVVALLANQFWKPGLVRGFLPAATTIIVTFCIVRYILLPFTNLTITNLDYMYADIARSLLSSPKSYIILVTAAFIASRMNLEYGWEFGGILIPSLLALEWYEPLKIVFTFGETLLIVVLASVTLRLPYIREANIEGARKILWFFTITFIYRMVLGHVIVAYYPEQKITDLYGFGYLLTTMIAIRMYDKHITARVTRATLQASLVSVVAASLIGFFLTWVPNYFAARAISSVQGPIKSRDLSEVQVMDELRRERVAMFKARTSSTFAAATAEEIDIFGEALRYVSAYLHSRSQTDLEAAEKLFSIIQYQVDRLQGNYLYIHELKRERGWGTYLINTQEKNELLVEVPVSLDEWGSLDAGVALYLGLGARALAIGGAGRRTSLYSTSDVLQNYSTVFRIFHREFAHGGVLQVRGYTEEMVRKLTGKRPPVASYLPPEIESTLWVRYSLPPALDLAELKKLAGPFRIEWRDSPFPNVLRETSPNGSVELMINRHDAMALMFRVPLGFPTVPVTVRDQGITGYLQDWLFQMKDSFPEMGSNLYVPAQLEQLMYLDQEVVTPLIRTSRAEYKQGEWTKEGLAELRSLSSMALPLGYEIIRYRQKGTGEDFVILSERQDSPKKRYWGTYVFRLGKANPYQIQVPRPRSEVNSFEYGVALFEQLKARALLIGACHPMTNVDGSSDIVKIENKESMFSLVGQILVREAGQAPMVVAQCRAFAFRPDVPAPTSDVVISLESGKTGRESMDPYTVRLLDTLEKGRLSIGFADGSPSVAGYEAGGILQAMSVDLLENKEFVVLWLSPVLRSYYREQTENRVQDQQCSALGIPTVQEDLYTFIAKDKRPPGLLARPEDLDRELRAYMQTQDVVVLDRIVKNWPENRYVRVVDASSKQSFLVVYPGDHSPALVANLFPWDIKGVAKVKLLQMTRQEVSNYVESRIGWLVVE